jgi:hypothetical protein
MSPKPQPRRAFRANRAATLTAAALSATLVLSGCFGSVGKAINAVHAAVNSIGNMKNLESQIKKGENAKFEATYQSTGSGSSAPKITLAQEPGGKWLYISPPSDGSGGTEYVSTGKENYSCSQASAGGKWACIESAETANNDIEAAPFYAYTGGYVYTAIEAASVLAALAGAKVVNSNTSINGISLKCVSLIATQNGVTSDDKWCVTSDGILGLVKSTSSNNSGNSSFEIKSLNRSPSSSIFTLPQGASVTTGASS